jgi:phospholipid/cholesterol/gamma-HCH transport system ATP-binding protein
MTQTVNRAASQEGAFDRERLLAIDDVIRTVAVTTSFDRRAVLDNVEITIRRGEVFVIMGPSGCGKTTLLRHLCGLKAPDQGSVFVGGQDIYALSETGMGDLRLCTGLSFQGGALLGGLTALENVALPLRENTDLSDELIRQIALMKLDMVDMLHAADVKPAKLSGGMKKRAAIARAIAMDPEIVFLDEPSAGLDPVTAAGVDNLISMLNRVFGITMIVVTHDLESANVIADRAVMLEGGNVLVVGDKETVWGHPDASVQNFLLRRLTQESGTKNDMVRIVESSAPDSGILERDGR